MKLILTAAAAALILPSAAFAQAGAPASTTANASAEIIQPLHIACGPMHFGQIAPLHTASAVTMNAQGTPLGDPDNIVVPGTRDNAQPSNCSVTGEIGQVFSVTLPTGATLSNGTQTMALTNFTISTDIDADPLNRLLEDVGGTGSNGFGVGAKLNVGADQPAGLYAGTFVVSVQYN